jgi:excisionase family DNA binding protein
MEKLVFTIVEAAEVLGFSSRSVRRLIADGLLRAVSMPHSRGRRIEAQELRRFCLESFAATVPLKEVARFAVAENRSERTCLAHCNREER